MRGDIWLVAQKHFVRPGTLKQAPATAASTAEFHNWYKVCRLIWSPLPISGEARLNRGEYEPYTLPRVRICIGNDCRICIVCTLYIVYSREVIWAIPESNILCVGGVPF